MLAPMAGIADSAARRLAREYGAAMVFSEMISAEGLCRDDAKTVEMMIFSDQERPIAIQLFGSDPERMAVAAQKASALGPDALDINMGCPARKVIKNGSGSALLKDLGKAREMARAVVGSTDLPVLAKIRSGWDHESIIAVDAAEVLEEAGVSAVTIHPRTTKQGFKGEADWSIVSRIKKSVGIPVVGSGDIRCAADAVSKLEGTGCDFVMIGRAATGNPWIFQSANRLLEKGWEPEDEADADKLRLAMRHLQYMVELKGERRGVKEMRKHVAAYTKGMPGSASFRAEYFKKDTILEALRSLKSYMESVEVLETSGRRNPKASEGL
jgi:nifR3 family TIM-barrel protein